jgi:hypothetical protein
MLVCTSDHANVQHVHGPTAMLIIDARLSPRFQNKMQCECTSLGVSGMLGTSFTVTTSAPTLLHSDLTIHALPPLSILTPNCVLCSALAFLVHIRVIDQQSRTPYLHTLRQTCNRISDVHKAMDKHREARPDSYTDA